MKFTRGNWETTIGNPNKTFAEHVSDVKSGAEAVGKAAGAITVVVELFRHPHAERTGNWFNKTAKRAGHIGAIAGAGVTIAEAVQGMRKAGTGDVTEEVNPDDSAAPREIVFGTLDSVGPSLDELRERLVQVNHQNSVQLGSAVMGTSTAIRAGGQANAQIV